MIKEGTNGVSRGQLREGVTADESMLLFIPLNEDPLDWTPKLKSWIKSWAGDSVEFLVPDNWFERGHDHQGGSADAGGFWSSRIAEGTFIWTLPPGVAEAAWEELRKACLKRQQSTHIIVCPRLLTLEWLKQLYKACNLVLSIPAGTSDYWSKEMFEPLILGFVFPFINRYPWQLRNTPKMFAMARKMWGLFEAKDLAAGNILRKFLLEWKRLQAVSQDVVQSVLYFEARDRFPRLDAGRQARSKRKKSQGCGKDRKDLRKKKTPKGRLP